MRSLRRRLLAGLLGLFVASWLAVSVATYQTTSRELEKLFDSDLVDFSRVLLGLLDEYRGGDAEDRRQIIAALSQRPERKPSAPPAFIVWQDGAPYLRSPDAPDFERPRHAGLDVATVAGQSWHTFTVNDGDLRLTLLVAEPARTRQTVVLHIARDALFPLLLALPLLALGVWIAVGRGLEPLLAVTRQLAQRSPDRLDPLATDAVPVEIGALVLALNRLLGRLDSALEAERRLTADAAHEIRTPLASLKTHAQVALRSSDSAVLRRALGQIELSVDRLSRLMDQILALARLDAQALGAGFEPVALERLAAEAIAGLAGEALRKQLEIGLDGSGHVLGHAPALALLIDNLVGNAIRYTPAGGAVGVRIVTANGRVTLEVADTGPGIPAEERARVFERFYRGSNVAEHGSGLGLATVRRIAELHGAGIVLAESAGGCGLTVRVSFAAAP